MLISQRTAPGRLPADISFTLILEGSGEVCVFLVRGELGQRSLTIADGYHRVCASYHLDEDADIPCRIVDLPD